MGMWLWMPSGFGATFDAWLRRKQGRLREVAKETVREVADDSAFTMQSIIATRPSAQSGKTGRVETGKMMDSVQSRKVHETKDALDVRFGYLRGRQLYYALQDQGFTHVPDGAWIQGTYALDDSYEWAGSELRKRLGDNLRGI